MKVREVPKRLLLGAPVRTDKLGDTLLPKRIALPIFSSSPISTVAYAPQEIVLALALAGTGYLQYGPWVGLAVAVLLGAVVASYRHTVRAYPSGGGDYEVAAVNLGRTAALTVAGGLVVGYVLTVSVSVSAAVDNIGAAIPAVAENRVGVALGLITVLVLVNLRGVREAGLLFAVPAYAFLAGMVGLVIVGLVRSFALDDALRAPSAGYDIDPQIEDLSSIGLAAVVLLAFSSGAAAVTGSEAAANGVPAFREPKGRNAATTMTLVAGVLAALTVGLVVLAERTGMVVAADPETAIVIDGEPAGPDYQQDPIIAQVATAVFGEGSPAFGFLTVTTALILLLAANTAFNGFPLLGSILARDGFLPKQLQQRGDRLVFSNGIVALGVVAGLLVYAFDGEVSVLIALYIVGLFTAYTLGRLGMARHWLADLRRATDRRDRTRGRWGLVVNLVGTAGAGIVLVVVLVSRFTEGAYVVLVAIPVLFVAMRAIREHYDRVATELRPPAGGVTLPSRIHGVVLISKMHTPALRALAFARATRPDTLTALTVQTSSEATQELLREWAAADLPVPLTVLDSPYREVTRPILDHVRAIRLGGPRDVVCVFIPEYVVGRWWEQLLHNQSALRLKARLLFMPGVMVTSVPWQLGSAELLEARRTYAPGAAALSRSDAASADGRGPNAEPGQGGGS